MPAYEDLVYMDLMHIYIYAKWIHNPQKGSHDRSLLEMRSVVWATMRRPVVQLGNRAYVIDTHVNRTMYDAHDCIINMYGYI